MSQNGMTQDGMTQDNGMTQSQVDTDADYGSAVALVGLSGRFPGARDVGALWDNLLAGVSGLREFTDEELLATGLHPGRLADPRYVRVGGAIEAHDHFDAAVFGINPREAATMGPQHRLFLECTWEALEGAGYCPTDMPGPVAVFAGSGFPDYVVQNLQPVMYEPGGQLLIAVGNERDSLASLVSYKLGLRGPAMGVQTFCSTSLVAVHLACQSLLTYECDMAIAGGAYVPLPQPSGYLYEQGGILSPDGRVRSFDAAANGTVMGSGVGVVALKRMTDALADGDLIRAVILGSAVNNDGRVRAGYTAPGVDGEAEVIDLALGVAGVKPTSVGYLECHATGTSLGDSIELAALNRVFASSRETPCVLSTLKPSLGHLDRASGVTGLIRASLCLENELLPGTPNYRSPNPALATAGDRFTVLTDNQPWPAGSTPRRAGVSSFGLGGTNAHVVLEQAPAAPARPHRAGPHLLIFSAVDATALDQLTTRLREHLLAHPEQDLADVAFTLQMSRGGFALRRALVCRDHADAVAALADPTRWRDAKTTRRNPKVALVPGADVEAAWLAELAAAAGGALADRLAALGVRLLHDGDSAGAAETIVIAPEPGESATEWLLATLARLWQAGSGIDWRAVHHGEGRRVALPTYPFQRKRYWIEAHPGSAPAIVGKNFDRSQWTYLPTWRPQPRRVADSDEQLRLAGPWLVFTDDPRGEALVARLLAAGAEVNAVRPGTQFGVDDAGDFTVRMNSAADMRDLLACLVAAPRAIVHGFALASAAGPTTGPGAVAHFQAEQERGFHSVHALATTLVDDTGVAPRAELVLLTSGAVGVVGSDLRHPEHASLAALGPSLAQENPRLRCRHVDVDGVADSGSDSGAGAGSGDAALGQLVEQLLTAIVTPHEGPVAVRAGELWLRHYEPHPLDELTAEQRPFRDGDTVLITGGLGDVGLLLSRHLASRYRCNLVLTARSPLPPRETWDDFLAAPPIEGAERTARHIKNILEMERHGAQVLAVSADAADAAAMRAVVDAALERFGDIDVVVHGAGVQSGDFFNFVHLMERPACEAHLAAKVTGFHVLNEVLGEALGDRAPDRRITLSSLAAVLGGMTLAPYAAANAGLDAYVRAARVAGAGRWISVNWDTWNIDPDRLANHGPGVTDYAMVPEEGVDVFERTLAAGAQIGQLVISTGPLDVRLEQWVTSDLHDVDDADDTVELHPRPELDTPYAEPREGTEATLAGLWSRVLGIDSIGADDNFFELGGHSLIAIDLTARIRKAFDVSIPVTGLLECPTVRQLAELIDAGPAEQPDDADPAEHSAAVPAEQPAAVPAEQPDDVPQSDDVPRSEGEAGHALT